MKAPTPTVDHAQPAMRPPLEPDRQPHERFDDELVMHLERDQFVAETSRPVPPGLAQPRVTVLALWALRVFVVLVSLMVIYTFFYQLH